jgi:arginase
MDSHTPETTETGRIHGMPLATLLGYGPPSLTYILSNKPKINPANLCLIGIRSFEAGEAKLLEKLKVKIFSTTEVKEKGCLTILKEAVSTISAKTKGFVISLDLDIIDPTEILAVDVPEPNGISSTDLKYALQEIVKNPKLLAAEIVEFNPSKDQAHRTEKLIVDLLAIFSNHLKINQ